MKDVFDGKSFFEKWKIYIPDGSYAEYLFKKKQNKLIENNKKNSFVGESFDWYIADNVLIDVKKNDIYKVILLLLQQSKDVLPKINEKMYDKDGNRNDFLENSTFEDVEQVIIDCGGKKLTIGYSACQNYLKEVKFIEEKNKKIKQETAQIIKEQEFLNQRKQDFIDCLLQDKRFICLITKIISNLFKSMKK